MRRRRLESFSHPGHVWWNRLQEAFPAHGWVSEQASQKLVFITPFARRLQPGETITISDSRDLHPNEAAPSHRYRVVGVTPYDCALSLVECRAEGSQDFPGVTAHA
jgi:hypothetical protein